MFAYVPRIFARFSMPFTMPATETSARLITRLENPKPAMQKQTSNDEY